MLDLSQLSKYKENNRIEQKRLKVGYPAAFGKHIRLLPTLSAVIFYSAL